MGIVNLDEHLRFDYFAATPYKTVSCKPIDHTRVETNSLL